MARLHGGAAQRNIYLQIHLSNTAGVTDRLCAVEWQMPAAWWPHCRTCAAWQKIKIQIMRVWQRRAQNKQLNGWTDGQLVTLNAFHLPLCGVVFFFSVCLFGSRENKIISADKTGGNAGVFLTQTLGSTSTRRRHGRTPAVQCLHVSLGILCLFHHALNPPAVHHVGGDNASVFLRKEQRCASLCPPVPVYVPAVLWSMMGMWMQAWITMFFGVCVCVSPTRSEVTSLVTLLFCLGHTFTQYYRHIPQF